MKTRKKTHSASFRSSLLPAVLLGLAAGAAGTSWGESMLSARTTRLVVFKDGTCMVTRQIRGRIDADRKAWVAGVPSTATLGAFWIRPAGEWARAAAKSGKGTGLKSAVARRKTATHGGRSETETRIDLEFDPGVPEGEVELEWTYLSPGVRWIPTYRIDLAGSGRGNATRKDDPPRAALSLQAEILNELEDFTGIPVDLVVGVPSFRFKDIVSPMTLQPGLANPLQQAAPLLMNQSLSNSLFTQRAGESRETNAGGPGVPAPGVPDLPASLAGEGAQDLFVHRIASLTLGAGERAAVPILSTAVPARSLHTWDVQLHRAASESLPAGSGPSSPLRLLRNEIWRQLEITNATETPFTTGAALVVEGDLPIAQELLPYAPAGGTTRLPLTVAVDVRGDYAEEEVSREVDGIRFDDNSYAKITKKGTLSVANGKKEAIALRITADFGGNATEASDNGAITRSDFATEDWGAFRGHPALVGHSRIVWNLEIPAGQTARVTCTYHLYTR